MAAEDKRFYEHNGIDERGLIRAFIGNLAHSGRPQGGSTITQQVVKNLLVGEDLTYERKIREMVVASRLEHTLSKAEILELYLNSVYLGRGSWGIELAARSYFGKAGEGAHAGGRRAARRADQGSELLSARPPSRPGAGAACLCAQPPARGRGHSPAASRRAGDCPRCLRWSPMSGRTGTSGSISWIRWRARRSRLPASTRSRPIRTRCAPPSICPCSARSRRRCRKGCGAMSAMPVACNFAARRQASPRRCRRSRRKGRAPDKKPAWQQALANARLPLYDVHWTSAIVVEKPSGKKGESWKVGLADGRIVPLSLDNAAAQTQARALRRGVCASQRCRRQGQGRRAGGAARAPDACRARWWSWRTRPGASWPWRGASPIR